MVAAHESSLRCETGPATCAKLVVLSEEEADEERVGASLREASAFLTGGRLGLSAVYPASLFRFLLRGPLRHSADLSYRLKIPCPSILATTNAPEHRGVDR